MGNRKSKDWTGNGTTYTTPISHQEAANLRTVRERGTSVSKPREPENLRIGQEVRKT